MATSFDRSPEPTLHENSSLPSRPVTALLGFLNVFSYLLPLGALYLIFGLAFKLIALLLQAPTPEETYLSITLSIMLGATILTFCGVHFAAVRASYKAASWQLVVALVLIGSLIPLSWISFRKDEPGPWESAAVSGWREPLIFTACLALITLVVALTNRQHERIRLRGLGKPRGRHIKKILALVALLGILVLLVHSWNISRGPTAVDNALRDSFLAEPILNGLEVEYENARDAVIGSGSRQPAHARVSVDTVANPLTHPKEACEEVLDWALAHEGWSQENTGCYEFSEGVWKAALIKGPPLNPIIGVIRTPNPNATDQASISFRIRASSAD